MVASLVLQELDVGHSEPPTVGAVSADPEAAGALSSEASGYMRASALEWKEGERTLLQLLRMWLSQLPLQKGLELDVDAAFVAAPSGQVTHCEMIRRSGYAFRLERKL